MNVTSEQLIEDIAKAANVACDCFFSVSIIEDDIGLELEVGSILDNEQLASFLEKLKSGEDLNNTDGYDIDSLGLKFERHNNDVFEVFWDEVVEILENDNL